MFSGIHPQNLQADTGGVRLWTQFPDRVNTRNQDVDPVTPHLSENTEKRLWIRTKSRT